MGDCYIHVDKHLISAFNLLYFTEGRSLLTAALGQNFFFPDPQKNKWWKIWRVLTKLYAYWQFLELLQLRHLIKKRADAIWGLALLRLALCPVKTRQGQWINFVFESIMKKWKTLYIVFLTLQNRYKIDTNCLHYFFPFSHAVQLFIISFFFSFLSHGVFEAFLVISNLDPN